MQGTRLLVTSQTEAGHSRLPGRVAIGNGAAESQLQSGANAPGRRGATKLLLWQQEAHLPRGSPHSGCSKARVSGSVVGGFTQRPAPDFSGWPCYFFHTSFASEHAAVTSGHAHTSYFGSRACKHSYGLLIIIPCAILKHEKVNSTSCSSCALVTCFCHCPIVFTLSKLLLDSSLPLFAVRGIAVCSPPYAPSCGQYRTSNSSPPTREMDELL